jgi:hypothetical protein
MTIEAAWDAVHEALPARWRVGPMTFDPGVLRADGRLGAFRVTARGPHPGRGKAPQAVAGLGDDEMAALVDLDARLRGVARPDGTQLEYLRRRLRHAYLEGAEEWTRDHLRRQMTTRELAGVVRRYPGR